MENEAFAPKEQMLHFPYFFQIHDIQRHQKVLLWSKGLSQGLISGGRQILFATEAF